MKQNNLFPFARRAVRRRFVAGMLYAGMLLFAASGCTDDAGTDNRLPAGKYPMTFTAALEGMTVTRATTDNSWTDGDEVAIQIGSEVKKYTVASDGSLSVASGGTPFYWQSTSDITVNAWYPYNGGSKPADNALTVKAEQNKNNGYQASDYLEAVDATVTFADKQLAFKHRTAKVVVTLQMGEGITDLNGASVTFVNQTGVEGSGSVVTPKAENAGGVTTYTALLVPKQMQGNQFIKVILGDYSYFYTPTGVSEANLTAGQQHTYAITVKKTGLDVTAQPPSQWTGSEESVTGNAQTVTPGTDDTGSSWGTGGEEAVTGTEKNN